MVFDPKNLEQERRVGKMLSFLIEFGRIAQKASKFGRSMRATAKLMNVTPERMRELRRQVKEMEIKDGD